MCNTIKFATNLLAIVFILSANFICAQNDKKPKLIIGIVVDQMRSEYLYRFQDNYSENGFKKLMRKGFNIKNAHYNYIPTETGPGHATIFTGTTPANHGIVSNNWYDRQSDTTTYCVADSTVFYIRSTKSTFIEEGKLPASPKNLLSTTFSDELKLHTNNRSKVIGVSLKDRAAILPVGHLADYAFWFDEKQGNFMSSSYYSDSLPHYINVFNKKRISDSLLNSMWRPLLSYEKYTNSNPDDSEYERIYKGNSDAMFPYNLKKLKKKNGSYKLLMQTPFGNTLLTKLAKTVIKEEALGQDDNVDFLSISYSSTDKVGHDFGIRSMELEDTYIRLDKDLGELLLFLDNEVGEDNYLLFLTSDHAASDNPKFLKGAKIPSGTYHPDVLKEALNEKLSVLFGKHNYIPFMDNTQIYVDEGKANKQEVLYKIKEYLNEYEGVKDVYIANSAESNKKDELLETSYNRRRSGDLYVVYYPGWMQDWGYGATHYTSYNNDTHVPMLWYGNKVKAGQSVKVYTTTQIVPTLSMLLNIPLPNSAEKKPMLELFNK